MHTGGVSAGDAADIVALCGCSPVRVCVTDTVCRVGRSHDMPRCSACASARLVVERVMCPLDTLHTLLDAHVCP